MINNVFTGNSNITAASEGSQNMTTMKSILWRNEELERYKRMFKAFSRLNGVVSDVVKVEESALAKISGNTLRTPKIRLHSVQTYFLFRVTLIKAP